LPEIPNFTDASWQGRRSEAQLQASILEGKGQGMPSFRGKLNEQQARDLTTHVRSFGPTTDKPGPDKPKGPTSAGSFEEEFRRLQQEMEELKKQSRELFKESPGRAPSRPSESQQDEVARMSAPPEAGTPAVRELFRRHCVKCHGADGTGSQGRDRLPEIPDFTNAPWQARRSDGQLLASIIDGKGKEMPPFREKISEEQARDLAAYVRTLAPATEAPAWEPEKPALAEPAEVKPTRGFFEKLILWLGNFHAPAVHFPIGLLTAAAVAELLRLVTGKPAFDAISRYCVWFGTLTAVAAGVLGWFVGGFRLTNASWVLVAHSLLGTSTVACAALALVLSELSRRADEPQCRGWIPVLLLVVAVLVLATGFFGGAVVSGFDHYTWPP
jgi:mono/diheme cytochrome c family protein/uncharacterized membrane protein